MNKNQTTWEFIEKYYPNYYSCDNILLNEYLLKKVESEPTERNIANFNASYVSILEKTIEAFLATQK